MIEPFDTVHLSGIFIWLQLSEGVGFVVVTYGHMYAY